MSKTELSRRRFFGGAATMAVALPLSPISAAAEMGPMAGHKAEISRSGPASIPYRELPARKRGTTVIPVDPPTDGVTDCSPAIQKAIDSLPEDGGTVLVRYQRTGKVTECVYMIDTTAQFVHGKKTTHYGIKLRSNMLLQFEPGVQLQARPNNLDRAYVLYLPGLHDVEIANGALIGERYTHTNSGKGTDEWGYGIAISGSTSVTVRSTHISAFEGDGIMIAGAGRPGTTPSDIVLWNVVFTNNRRQALSITRGNGIHIFDCVLSDTHGTAPSDGIDIEGSVSNVWIDNCIIQNNQGNGVEINGSSGKYTIANINITNCVLSGNYSGVYVGDRATSSVDGGTIYGNAIYQNRSAGIHFGGPTSKNFTIGGTKACDTKNNSFANNSTSSTQVLSPISAKAEKKGYVAGTDMLFSDPALEPAKNNVIGWNFYYDPKSSFTGPQQHPCKP